MIAPVLNIDETETLVNSHFGRAPVQLSHNLHTSDMFDDEALAAVLDRYPRDKLGVFSMGTDEENWSSWRRGQAGDLDGRSLLDIVRKGRVWLNLRETNRYLPEYAELSDDMFGALEARFRGLRTFKRDVGLLISSPRTQVFYHLDVARVTLWHLRGEKRVWLYPVEPPFVDDETLEAIVLRQSAEQIDYKRAWDEHATVYDLKPGDMVHWPQNAPHRIVNGDSLNVSLSAEFLSPGALIRANAIWANGFLRQRFGATPRLHSDFHPAMIGKFLLARLAKAAGVQANPPEPIPASFAIDPAMPDFLRPLQA